LFWKEVKKTVRLFIIAIATVAIVTTFSVGMKLIIQKVNGRILEFNLTLRNLFIANAVLGVVILVCYSYYHMVS